MFNYFFNKIFLISLFVISIGLLDNLWSLTPDNIFGRRSHITGINDKNYNVRNFQERAAINAPIQGSASEIMRLAMIRLDKNFKNLNNLKSKILLQIHDELIFEVPNNEVKSISKIIKNEMTSVTDSDLHSFSTPLTVDINIGENWGILH